MHGKKFLLESSLAHISWTNQFTRYDHENVKLKKRERKQLILSQKVANRMWIVVSALPLHAYNILSFLHFITASANKEAEWPAKERPCQCMPRECRHDVRVNQGHKSHLPARLKLAEFAAESQQRVEKVLELKNCEILFHMWNTNYTRQQQTSTGLN